MTRRTCPACAKRYAGTVNPDCPVCEGVGVLALGDPALYRSTPEAVSRAVELYLEAFSREIARELPPNHLRGDALYLAAQRLREAGVIGPALGVAEETEHDPDGYASDPGGPERRIADYHAMRLLAAEELQRQLIVVPKAVDMANVDADQVVYSADDRPRAAGLLPNTSAEGWPSFLVRAADPTDPLGPSTREQVYERQARDRAGAVIASAVDRVCEIKERRAAKAPKRGLAAIAVAPLMAGTV